MMIKKYKIGNFTAEITSQTDFQDINPYSLFLYNGEQLNYSISVEFSSELPQISEKPHYISQDRVCVYENNVLRCFYKSRDTEAEYYACRSVCGKNINILIDEKYIDMLWTRVIFSLIGIEDIVIENNGCVLHASFIESNGEAILFTGPCGIGKSTQANLWKKHADAVIVNGDKTLIFEKDGVFYASGLPFSGSSKDCLNKVLPLKAIISLQQAKSNTAQRLTSTDAFIKIFKNCYPVPHSQKLTGRLIDFAQRLSQSVPVYEYACLADESAVRHLERELCPIMQNL